MIQSVTRDGFVPGELPAKFEAGTPPIVEAIGLAAAADYLSEIGFERISEHERILVQRMHARLGEVAAVHILGPACAHKGGIVGFGVTGTSHFDLAVHLDLQGYAVRLGHHCAMPLHQFLGRHDSLRASFYLYNTLAEVDGFVEALQAALQHLRG